MKVFTGIEQAFLFCLAAWTFASPALAPAAGSEIPSSSPGFEAVRYPTLDISRTSLAIDVDGDLDDPGWSAAACTARFAERMPGDATEPAVPTEVLVTYDDRYLYVAFLCSDDPHAVRATMCQRDQIPQDDLVGVYIDTFGDAAAAYKFLANPLGIQYDMLWTSTQGNDAGYDLIYNSAGKITETGYQVEFAIPFSAMRFPGEGLASWKADFWRMRPRESSFEYAWATYDRNEQCGPCQWGTLNGIEQVDPGRGIELLSSIVADQSGRFNAATAAPTFENRDVEADVSLGGKYTLSSAMTAEATYNPDFSQIEADAAQIDVNTTIALRFEERRPFFQEGSDIFRTLFNSFYTRTVNDPQYAGKVTSRVGRATFGYLVAGDENSPYLIPLEERSLMVNAGRSVVNVLRGSLSFAGNSRAGFMVTDRRFSDGGYGTVFSVDGDVRLSRNYSWVGQFITTRTGEPDEAGPTGRYAGLTFDRGRRTVVFDGESFTGNAFITQLRRNGRHFSFNLNADQVEPGYRTETGYDPWNDYRNGVVTANYTIDSDHSLFERGTLLIQADRRWNFSDRIKWTHGTALLAANLRFWQTYAQLSYTAGRERWSGREFDDLWRVDLHAGSQVSDAVGFNLEVNGGRSVAVWVPALGNEVNASAEVSLKPLDRLILEPSLSYTRSTAVDGGEELYEQFITRTRFRFQANRQLSLRLVLQYNNAVDAWDVDPLLAYQLSPFSVFYLGSAYNYGKLSLGDPTDPTNWRLTSRQFFAKIQYLFQI